MKTIHKVGLSILISLFATIGLYAAGQQITSLTQTVSDGDIITAGYYNTINGLLGGSKVDGKMCKFVSGKIVCIDDVPTGGGGTSSTSSSGGGAIDGTCGSDAGVRPYLNFSTPPTNLCLTGLSSTVNMAGNYTYIWLCNGIDGGVTSVCTATQGEEPFGDSDKTLKKDIKPIEGAYSFIEKLNGVHFNWKDSGKKDIGFIAQEVQTVFPELVRYDESRGVYQVSYQGVIPVLVEAMKQQEKRHQQDMDNLKKQIEEIKKDLK